MEFIVICFLFVLLICATTNCVRLGAISENLRIIASVHAIQWISTVEFESLVNSEKDCVVFCMNENSGQSERKPMYVYQSTFRGLQIGTRTTLELSLTDNCKLVRVRPD